MPFDFRAARSDLLDPALDHAFLNKGSLIEGVPFNVIFISPKTDPSTFGHPNTLHRSTDHFVR